MSLIKWSPNLEPFAEFDRWFDMPQMVNNLSNFVPAIDIYEDNENVYIETPLPGIDPEKVDISIENNVLTIDGKSEKKTEVDEKNYYRKEVKYGSFYRVMELPSRVKSNEANANYENGVLKITIPKEEKAKSTKVKIDVKNS